MSRVTNKGLKFPQGFWKCPEFQMASNRNRTVHRFETGCV